MRVLAGALCFLALTACGEGLAFECPVGTRLETRSVIEYTWQPGLNISTGQYDMKWGPKLVTKSECVDA